MVNNGTPKLSVELFRDAEMDLLDSEPFEAAVSYLNMISEEGLSIVAATRAIKITQPSKAHIDVDAIRWPRLSADLNIIATERPIYSRPPGDHREFSDYAPEEIRKAGKAFPLTRASLVDVRVLPGATSSIAAHEIGHLLGLKGRGGSADSKGHCVDVSCLMRPTVTIEHSQERVAQKGVAGLLERLGMVKPHYRATTIHHNGGFCPECAQQLCDVLNLRRAIKGRLKKVSVT